jgi:hypothetical protein
LWMGTALSKKGIVKSKGGVFEDCLILHKCR